MTYLNSYYQPTLQRRTAATLAGVLATLLCTGLAAPAQAQSNVTIFGGVDLSMTVFKAGGQRTTAMEQGGNLQPSRFGFRGSEDLGDGLKAGFWLESAVLPDTGAQQGALFHRRSTLSLESRTLGELRMGRDYTPTFWNLSRFSPLGTVGVGGNSNIIEGYPFGVGGARTLARANNSVGYFLPSGLGGVYGQVMVALPEGGNGARYTGLRLGYASGPLDVAAAYGTTPVGGLTHKVSTLGARYAFNSWTLMGYVFQQMAGADKQTHALVGATVPTGAGAVRVAFAQSNRSGPGVDADDAQEVAIGYVYPLSKRTALYSTYSRILNKGKAAYTTSDASPAATPGGTASGLQLGISHSF